MTPENDNQGGAAAADIKLRLIAHRAMEDSIEVVQVLTDRELTELRARCAEDGGALGLAGEAIDIETLFRRERPDLPRETGR